MSKDGKALPVTIARYGQRGLIALKGVGGSLITEPENLYPKTFSFDDQEGVEKFCKENNFDILNIDFFDS